MKKTAIARKLMSIITIGGGVLASGFSFGVSAEEILLTEPPVSGSDGGEITPYMNNTIDAILNTADYANVTTDNNWIDVQLVVTNSASNPGDIVVRIIDEAGSYVGLAQTISSGSSATFYIPFDAGTYTIQARALTYDGTYSLRLKD